MARTTPWMITLAALAFSGLAQANDVRQLTREEGRHAFFKARAAGTLAADGDIGSVPQIGAARPYATRAEVRSGHAHAKQDATLPGNGLVGPARTEPGYSIPDHEAGRVH